MGIKKIILYSLTLLCTCMFCLVGISNKVNAQSKKHTEITKTTLTKSPIVYGDVQYNAETDTLSCDNFYKSTSLFMELKSDGTLIISSTNGGEMDTLSEFLREKHDKTYWSYVWWSMELYYGVDIFNTATKISFEGNVVLPTQYRVPTEAKSTPNGSCNPILDTRISAEKERDANNWSKLKVIDFTNAHLSDSTNCFTEYFFSPTNGTISFSDGRDSYTYNYKVNLDEIIFPDNFITSKITSLCCLFSMTSVKDIKGLDKFDTSQVETLERLFDNCLNLKNIDLSSWDYSKLKYTSNLFIKLPEVEVINLGELHHAPNLVDRGANLFSYIGENVEGGTEIVNFNELFNKYKSLCGLDCNIKNAETITLESPVYNEKYNINGKFAGLKNLKKIDMSKLDYTDINEKTYQVKYVRYYNIEEDKLVDTNSKTLSSVDGIFNGVPDFTKIITPNSLFKLPYRIQEKYEKNNRTTYYDIYPIHYIVNGKLMKSGEYIKQSTEITIAPDTYVATYDFNGGTYKTYEGIRHIVTKVGRTHKIEFTPTKKNTQFLGWKINGEGEIITELPNTRWEDITLVAIYEGTKYNITYNGVEDSINPNPAQYEYGTELVLQDATKEGYDFEGWYSDPEFNIPVLKISAASEKDKTLYAHFIDNHSSYRLENAVQATCTSKGYSGDKVCNVCGEVIEKGHEINEIEHTLVLEGAKAATCKTPGHTGNYVCTMCKQVITPGKEIPATGNHTWDDGVITKEATKTETGEMTYTCTVCGDTKVEIIPVITETDDHSDTELRNVMEATCTKEGYSGDIYCKKCGKKLSTGTVVDKKPHDYTSVITKPATVDEEGLLTYICNVCGDTYNEIINKLTENVETYKVNIDTIKEDVAILPNTEIVVDSDKAIINGAEVKVPEKLIIFTEEGKYTVKIGDIEYVVNVSKTGTPIEDKPKEEPKQEDDKKEDKSSTSQESTTQPTQQVKEKQSTTTKQSSQVTTQEPTTEKVLTTGSDRKIKISKIANLKCKALKNKIKVTFKKQAGCKYEIQISIKKNFKKNVRVYKTAKTSYTIKKLKKNKTYYIRVRGINGDNIGKWSKIIKVKIKK